MTTLANFISANRITMTAELTDRNPDMVDDAKWAATATHWKCSIRAGRRAMTVYFSQGPEISGEPSISDVLDCLASDASSFENAGDFEAWCGEFGYDTDSRRHERTYHAIQRQAASLQRILGEQAYSDLLWNVERR